MKTFYITVFFLLNFLAANAQNVNIEQAKKLSENWATAHGLNPGIEDVIPKKFDGMTLLYIVNFKSAWVMISADHALKPVLGFSFDSPYPMGGDPQGLQSLFAFYDFAKRENKGGKIDFSKEWESLESGHLKTANSANEVEPLIKARWGQAWPFNAYCPLDNDPDLPDSYNGHHNTSCGPTAFAQVLSYWKYPVRGVGYHSYTYEKYGLVEADFGSTVYNWDNMPLTLKFSDPESKYTDVATLMLHAGVSADESIGSGGTLSNYSSAAVKYFNYSPDCEVFYRNDFTRSQWHNIFRKELNNGRPIMMSGCSAGSAEPWEYGTHYGHYFVCDGYYGEDFYHINWGWKGSGNGYFPLYSLGDYVYQNDALIGLEPNYEKKELVMNDPYSVDNNTLVLLHFDGDFENQSSLTSNPEPHGNRSFVDNSALGLGQCLYLNNSSQGNQSYLDIADHNNLDLSGDWTIEMWFKPKSFGNSSSRRFTLINKVGSSNKFSSNYAVYMIPSNDWYANSLRCFYYPTEQVERNPASMGTDRGFLELNTWYHFVFTRNTSDKTLKLIIHDSERKLLHYASMAYCNEVASQPLINSNPLFIGSSNQSNTYFDGYIDELRISNVVREFEISSTALSLLAPKGGEVWQSGSQQQINWSCENIENVKIEYSTDNGNSWQLISNSTPASTGHFDWMVPETSSLQCFVRITDTSDENTYHKNSSPFEINDLSTLRLLSPNGGEYLYYEDVIPISWGNTNVSNIKISYSKDTGMNWIDIAASVPTVSNSYSWSVPDEKSGHCLIRIEDAGNPSAFDNSDAVFSIGVELPKALQFDGTDDYAQAVNFNYPSDDLTIEAWIKPAELVETVELIFGKNLDNNCSVQFRLEGTGGILYGESPNWTYVGTNGDLIVVNEWSHIALVRSDGLCTIYVNGIKEGEGVVHEGVNPTTMNIGGRIPNQDRFYKGLMLEVRVWDIARSQADIQSHMSSFLNGSENGLIAYWQMNEGEGQTVFDMSDNNYHLQLGSTISSERNDPEWVSALWPFMSQSLSIFDIQYTTIPGEGGTYPSLMVDNEATVTGIVTAIGFAAYGNNFFISDPEGGIWHGIYIYKGDESPELGDEVEVSGLVMEYYGGTQINTPEVSILSSGNPLPDAILVQTGNLIDPVHAEAYEGCLVKVVNAVVTQESDNLNQWYVDDGSGECQVDDKIFAYDNIRSGDQFNYIVGVIDYDWSEYGINPRSGSDFSIGMIPQAPSNPNPENTATSVPLNCQLSWSICDNTESIDLFFGTDNPPTDLVMSNVSRGSGYSPPGLDAETNYFWKVICRNAQGTSDGSVWTFITGQGTGVDLDKTESQYLIFPNPSSTNIYIKSPRTVGLTLYDIRGEKVLDIEHFTAGHLDVSGYKKGIYLLVFSSEEGFESRKIVFN
ncbi:MAG: T9SS type A sorting domain-containing protein [Bacteroidetes bacterium]|jgi:hypothetical protein|nr:T9SS type A sorting domain-containing protein [Bacteroidota bacterium]MBT7466208.1 T9SS type A sorting domain-containing protein [Bacteroidota bacterium]